MIKKFKIDRRFIGQPSMRIGILHTKDFTDYVFLSRKMSKLTKKLTKGCVVLCRRMDKLSQQWATEKLIIYGLYHSPSAEDLPKEAKALIVFVKSKIDDDTQLIIEECKELGLKVRIIYHK